MSNSLVKSMMGIPVMLAVLALAQPAFSQDSAGSVSAPQPNTFAQPIRIIPVAGRSSMSNSSDLKNDRFDQGSSLGLFVDVGQSMWNFETGVLTLTSNVNTANSDSTTVSVDTWGIPLLAKLNLSGKPHETVFLKAGVMPFKSTGNDQSFNVMGVGGIGANIPLGHNSSIILDAAYNRLFTNNAEITNYQGISLLAGLSFNI